MEGRQQQQCVILVPDGNRSIGFCVMNRLPADSVSNRDMILFGCRELQRGEDTLHCDDTAKEHLSLRQITSLESGHELEVRAFGAALTLILSVERGRCL